MQAKLISRAPSHEIMRARRARLDLELFKKEPVLPQPDELHPLYSFQHLSSSAHKYLCPIIFKEQDPSYRCSPEDPRLASPMFLCQLCHGK